MPALTWSSSPGSRHPAERPSRVRLWLNRIRTRRALAALDPDQLRDIGLEPWALRAEIRKPFWRG
jgi:uncharacterized protein YjiS (DUF1127 family)